jgi:3-oxoacyl-[acyl-carrier protein] reductase
VTAVTPAQPSWVIVSGAAGNFGQSIVRHYAGSGRIVLALDQQEASLQALAVDGRVHCRACDLAAPDAIDAVLKAVMPLDARIELLVNAVGLIWNEPVMAAKGARLAPHDLASFERVVRANLTTAFVMSSRVAVRMARSGGGSIINFSSIAARGNAGQVAYSAAKAGVEGMTRAMAQELGPLGVRVNAIAPGFIDVASTRAALKPEVLEQYTRRTPMKRMGTLDEIVAAVESLHGNSFLNGVVLEIDGGLRF